jgi:hypothetical protein
MSPKSFLIALLCGATLSACSPDEKTLRELSTVESLSVCNAYVDESRRCMGFDMRCPEQVQGVCTRKQLVDTCLEGLTWSTCPVTRFERCFMKDLCQVQDDGAVLPCFVQCMTESNAELQ